MEKHEFERQKIDKEQEKKQEEQLLPAYFRPIDGLSEADKERLVKEIDEERKEIEKERVDSNRETTWESLSNQYKGLMEDTEDRQFNLSKPTTKIKIRGASILMHKSLFESDPIYNISPRPEFHREGGDDVADKQTDFLDYKLDTEGAFKKVKRKVINSACIYGVGIEKMFHKIKRRKRKRSETIKGNPIQEVMQTPQGQIVRIVNKPLEDFLREYPDAPESYIKDLQEGKEIHYEVEYMETVKNDPLPKFVNIRNFYVRESCDGYEDLGDQLLIEEETCYSWWELKRLERRGIFNNIDELKYKYDKQGTKADKLRDSFRTREYTIRECTYQAKLNESDEEEVKCVFWVEEDSKIMIGASYYPWDGIDCIYNPHHIKQEVEGFYQPGMAEDLTDINLVENLFLNFGLEGAWTSNMITPLTPKGSDIDQQFLNKEWAHGVPMNIEEGEKIDFLQKYMKPTSLRDIIVIMQTLAKTSDDVSGYNQMLSGRESEIDPNAPASKTIALMQQSGINVADYVKCLLPAFNRTADMLLQMYHQISKEGRQYKMRPDRVTGDDPFTEISREEMIARTNIEAKAATFDFDKLNERRSDLALYQVIRQELMIAKNPDAVYTLLKNLIKSWSPKWKNIGEKILPTLRELHQKEMAVALQGAAAYLNQVMQKVEQTGAPIEKAMNLKKMKAMVDIARKDLVTQPSKEEMKAREQMVEKGRENA